MNTQTSTSRNIEKGPLTIGIRGTGPATGKDAATGKFVELLEGRGLKYTHGKFATPLRQVMETLLGIPMSVSESTEGKNMVIPSMGITTGQCLQKLGTVLRETLYQGVMIDALMRGFKPDERVIISDVRMKTEQIAVKQRGGIVILIDSNREVSAEAMAGRSSQHETERDLDGVQPDYVIKNNGTLEELYEKIEKLVKEVFPEADHHSVTPTPSQQENTVVVSHVRNTAPVSNGFAHIGSPCGNPQDDTDPYEDTMGGPAQSSIF